MILRKEKLLLVCNTIDREGRIRHIIDTKVVFFNCVGNNSITLCFLKKDGYNLRV